MSMTNPAKRSASVLWFVCALALTVVVGCSEAAPPSPLDDDIRQQIEAEDQAVSQEESAL